LGDRRAASKLAPAPAQPTPGFYAAATGRDGEIETARQAELSLWASTRPPAETANNGGPPPRPPMPSQRGKITSLSLGTGGRHGAALGRGTGLLEAGSRRRGTRMAAAERHDLGEDRERDFFGRDGAEIKPATRSIVPPQRRSWRARPAPLAPCGGCQRIRHTRPQPRARRAGPRDRPAPGSRPPRSGRRPR
jgi:hypothetical protein